MRTTEDLGHAPGLFRHEAFLYRGAQDFLSGVSTFVRESVAASEPVLVAVSGDKVERLQHELDDLHGHEDQVLFSDITGLGRNPARMIPAWRDFLSCQPAGKRVRGVGEPPWKDLSRAELREAQRHESLLGVAFGALDDFWLLCPYDVLGLSADVVDEAYRSHPYVLEGQLSVRNDRHEAGADVPGRLDEPLQEPPASAHEVRFRAGELAPLRRVVGSWTDAQGAHPQRRELFVFVTNELTTNSVEHGGGEGTLLLWRDGDQLVAEVRDRGHIAAPLVGRVRPDQQQGGGRGVWLVNQICDLVQIRSRPGTTVVRARLSADGRGCGTHRRGAQ